MATTSAWAGLPLAPDGKRGGPRRVNLVPMAGAGQRFRDKGYRVPKPMIPVAGVPMVVRAARSLPDADHWVFVCRASHVLEDGIGTELQRQFPGAAVITVDRHTEGQAATCLLATPELRHDDRLTIGACDNGMTYDRAALDALWAGGAEAIVWTFRRNPAVLQNPAMYGWVDADAAGGVRRISCKVPLSDKPMDDHAIIGTFSFRRAAEFLRATERTIALDRRVNGEYYVDIVLDQAVADGLDVRVFEVDHYAGWGTPQDLDTYLYWRQYFAAEGS
jgi:NDP-sugar pyrophosphorylase family protein